MKFISDKTSAFKSLAVWLPTIVSALLLFIDQALQLGVVPVEVIPLVVFVSGFLGRIVKQKDMKE